MSDDMPPCSAEPCQMCVIVRIDRPTRLLTIAEAREFARSLLEAARLAAEYEEPDTPEKARGRRAGAATKLKRVLTQKQLFTEVEG